MPSLQIRELPPDVYEALALRAEREGRSLTQQAIAELRKVAELEARKRRLEILDRLRRGRGPAPLGPDQPPPERLIREDRGR